MSNFRQFFTTPVGRMLWGSHTKIRTTDRQGKPLLDMKGNARQEIVFGVAFEKSPGQAHWAIEPADWKTKYPSLPYWGSIIWAVGCAAFPAQSQNPRFAWKIVDGDSAIPNENGTIPKDQDGFPGHWIVTFKSQFAPKCYNNTGSQEIDPAAIKTGYFVQVSGSVDGNGNANKAGVFVNHGMVSLAGYGPEITAGPDPRSVGFGGGAHAPAGMSATPVGGVQQPVPGAPAAPVAPPMPQAPVYAPPPVPGAPAAPAAPQVPMVPVVPSQGFVQPPGVPTAPPPPPAPPAGPVWKGPPGSSYAAYKAANWSDEQMRQNGLLG